MILSLYFLVVVSSFYHELVAPADLIKQKEKAAVSFITEKEGGSVSVNIEEQTVLVNLEQDPSPALPRHPCPEEVITLPAQPHPEPAVPTNPFATDAFNNDSNKQINSEVSNHDDVKMTKPKSQDMNLKANFTPFKKSRTEKTPAKMNVFLPGGGNNQEDESDFDFSFNDPDFDSSLCADTHHGVE